MIEHGVSNANMKPLKVIEKNLHQKVKKSIIIYASYKLEPAFSSDYVSAAHSSAALVIVNWWYRPKKDYNGWPSSDIQITNVHAGGTWLVNSFYSFIITSICHIF